LTVDQIIPTLRLEAQNLVKQFRSTFPGSLPKHLPSKCSVEYTIDLVDGTKAVVINIYRMINAELKDLKRQLND